MTSKALRKREKGQGMIEYALILVLVAIVVIVVVGSVGNGVNRVFAIINAAMGASHNAEGDHYIEITTSQCVVETGVTGLWVTGITNEALNDLTGSTESGVGTVNGNAAPINASDSIPNGFEFNYVLKNAADASACPRSVAIQAKDGTLAFSPITVTSQ